MVSDETLHDLQSVLVQTRSDPNMSDHDARTRSGVVDKKNGTEGEDEGYAKDVDEMV